MGGGYHMSKSYEQKLWTEVLNPSWEQNLAGKLRTKHMIKGYKHKLWPRNINKICKQKVVKKICKQS